MSLTIERRFRATIKCDGLGDRECGRRHVGQFAADESSAILAAGLEAGRMGWERFTPLDRWRCSACVAWMERAGIETRAQLARPGEI